MIPETPAGSFPLVGERQQGRTPERPCAFSNGNIPEHGGGLACG